MKDPSKQSSLGKWTSAPTNATCADYTNDHRAWQQRIDKEIQAKFQKETPVANGIFETPEGIHDKSYNLYETGLSNPNSIKQRYFKQHYRNIYKSNKH